MRALKDYQVLCEDVLSGLSSVESESQSLIVSSPPYNIGKSYERGDKRDINEYREWQEEVASQLVRTLKDDGSICWQVGNHVKNNEAYPLDYLFYEIFKNLNLKLRNRIIWRFNFGLNSKARLSGRYETVLWFTKSDDYRFNLDPIRIPQLYPGKRHSAKKKDKAGTPSGNPKGKNPSDFWEFSAEDAFMNRPIWEVPNVKANHREATIHPCQFPIELVERCVLAFTREDDSVLDPFVGSGTAMLAALKHDRRAIGIDRDKKFAALAQERIALLAADRLPYREIGQPVPKPNVKDRVARRPAEWEESA